MNRIGQITLIVLFRMRQSKPWMTMVETRVEVSGFVKPRRLG
jgi:hypothetical protein